MLLLWGLYIFYCNSFKLCFLFLIRSAIPAIRSFLIALVPWLMISSLLNRFSLFFFSFRSFFFLFRFGSFLFLFLLFFFRLFTFLVGGYFLFFPFLFFLSVLFFECFSYTLLFFTLNLFFFFLFKLFFSLINGNIIPLNKVHDLFKVFILLLYIFLKM